MPGWLRHNWHLKVLALVIAVGLWLFVVGSERRQMSMAAPVAYVGLPAEAVLASDPNDRVDLQLEVSRWAMHRVTPDALRVRVNLAQLGEGESTVPLSPADVETPPGVRVTRVTPPWARVTLLRASEQALPVVPRVRGTPAPGFAVRRVVAEPSSVLVRGPRSTIEERDRVETVPVDVSGLRATLTKSVKLLLPDLVQSPRNDAVEVTVEISPEERTQDRGGRR
jgi:YbbR domain-containing protein